MKAEELIQVSKGKLEASFYKAERKEGESVFTYGARWMFLQMNESEEDVTFNDSINYTGYGMLKYGMSLLFFTGFLVMSSYYFLPLMILSVLVFFIVEVHFLFLFPLLLDECQEPIKESINQVYKIGVFKSVFMVLRIAVFMVVGLFYLKRPLYNWYVGCLAVVIWYQDEVRNRI